MNMKPLAIAAALVSVAGTAGAADLAHPVKAAVDYVKVCDSYGEGFFYIPGSETCLQISGFARETVTFGDGKLIYVGNGITNRPPLYLGSFYSSWNANRFRTQTEVELDFDARTTTDFGLLRSYISVDVDYNSAGSGTYASGTAGVALNRGYIQWGPITAGRVESMFDFYFGGGNDQIAWSEVFPDQTVNLLAYTLAFGHGVTATLSVEDSTTSTRTQASAGDPLYYNTYPTLTATPFTYGGNKTPDLVANLNVTQGWGSAQVAGALHEVNGAYVNGTDTYTYSKWGYALLAGAKFNLPGMGPGDSFGLQGTYGVGAMKMVASEFFSNGDIGVDAVGDYQSGALHLTRAWALGAGFDHHFTPAVDLALSGGVLDVDGHSDYFANGNDYLDYVQWSLGSTLTWAPTPGLTIAGELEYTNLTFNSKTLYSSDFNGLSNGSAWLGGLRVKRAF